MNFLTIYYSFKANILAYPITTISIYIHVQVAHHYPRLPNTSGTQDYRMDNGVGVIQVSPMSSFV